MTEIALTPTEKLIITELVNQQLIRFVGHPTTRQLAAELVALSAKLHGDSKTIMVRSAT